MAEPQVYMGRSLVEYKAFARSLARRVWEKGSTCCACGDRNVSIWIIEGVHVANGFIIFARLFCKEHEKKWKNSKMLSYEKINGVLLMEMPYQRPTGMRINMSWSEFMNFMKAHVSDDLYFKYVEAQAFRQKSFVSTLTKNAHLIFVGKLKHFLEEK